MKRFLPALMLAATPAMAQDVVDCDWQAQARNVAEPWAENSAVFAEGQVRVAKLDTIEPAAGGFHLLILSPPYAELGDRQCKVITWDSIGFATIEFGALESAYDPAIGLMFSVPVRISEGSDFTNPAMLQFSLNQATGEIGTNLELGRE